MSGCALVRFYVGRVVVTLHLEDGGLPIADIYHARILAGTANYLGASGGQFLKVNARAFIAAMLRPHDRENAKRRQVGLAPPRDRKTVVKGKSVYECVDLGGCSTFKKKRSD